METGWSVGMEMDWPKFKGLRLKEHLHSWCLKIGLPYDPENPLKSICPGKTKASI